MTALINNTEISRIVAMRNSNLQALTDGLNNLETVFETSKAIKDSMAGVLQGNTLYQGENRVYGRLFGSINKKKAVEELRQDLDVSFWRGLMKIIRFHELMDKTARDQFEAQLESDVPELTQENVEATFGSLFKDADFIFRRGVAVAFTSLDRRFKTHNGFKIGSRVILTNVLGFWGQGERSRDLLNDIHRALCVISGDQQDVGLPWSMEAQKEYDTPHFVVRTFLNGNAHLWFKDDHLIEKLNKLLAEFYGDVIPDAWETAHKQAERATKKQKTDLSADLQFYPTPQAVVEDMLSCVDVEGKIVLEPSAGEGSIVQAALGKKAARVDCFEVDQKRAAFLSNRFEHHTQVSVQRANFLAATARSDYDVVLMNPPFYKTHYMKHIQHAYDFLKPGGSLVAIVPATLETGQTKEHSAFRAWCKERTYGSHLRFRDLPIASFRESGTNISTGILTLQKPR